MMNTVILDTPLNSKHDRVFDIVRFRQNGSIVGKNRGFGKSPYKEKFTKW